MAKRALTIIAVVLIIIIAAFLGICFGWKLLGFKTCIDPASIKLEYVDADNDYIILKGYTTASDASFLGYIFEIEDGNVYIGIHYNKISGYFKNDNAFNIVIRHNLSSFSGIYIKNEANERLIWEKGPELADPEKITALSGDNELKGYDEYKQLAVNYFNYPPELISQLRVYQAEKGNFSAGSNATVILLGLLSEDNPLYCTPLLFIEGDEGETLCKELTDSAYFTEFYLADIDGDHSDEIIIHNEIEAKSEPSPYTVSIFKWEDGDLINIFYHDASFGPDHMFDDSFAASSINNGSAASGADYYSSAFDTNTDEDSNGTGDNMYDIRENVNSGSDTNYSAELRDNAAHSVNSGLTLGTGFELVLSDGFSYTIENMFTGFSITFVRQNFNPYFDENGNLTDIASLINNNWDGTDPYFHIFKPVDYNNDGIFEIMSAQYCSLWGRNDIIGTAYSLMQWNNEKQSFDIIKNDFWVNEDHADHNEQENYMRKQSAFERSWYYYN
ncbi:MAG: hypothetical protein LBK69_01265 [Syntrophomonadaceae bacterium]|jgi:hypothetical protein|nr:hypothetical protein [Syntrophomonadaceae bacterium]